jgi:HSP20 family protein
MLAFPRNDFLFGRDFHEGYVSSNDKEYTLVLEVPGMSKEDIKIEVENNYLSISGEIKILDTTKTLRRKFLVPKDVDSIEATTANGLLTITLAKTPQSQKRLIQIK